QFDTRLYREESPELYNMPNIQVTPSSLSLGGQADWESSSAGLASSGDSFDSLDAKGTSGQRSKAKRLTSLNNADAKRSGNMGHGDQSSNARGARGSQKNNMDVLSGTISMDDAEYFPSIDGESASTSGRPRTAGRSGL